MLNIGFSELMLVVVVALLLIRPKDYPTVIRSLAKVVRDIRALIDGVRGQVDGVMKAGGLTEVADTARSILDLEGKPQPTYDISDLLAPPPPPSNDKAAP